MVDVNKTVEQMTDGELAELMNLAALIKDAERESKRRRDEAEGVKVVTMRTPSVKHTTDAPCPLCGRRDSAISSKTMYADESLAQGRVVGTAAYCGPCRIWYDAGTGELADMRFTY